VATVSIRPQHSATDQIQWDEWDDPGPVATGGSAQAAERTARCAKVQQQADLIEAGLQPVQALGDVDIVETIRRFQVQQHGLSDDQAWDRAPMLYLSNITSAARC
jgi:hypothetical protein